MRTLVHRSHTGIDTHWICMVTVWLRTLHWWPCLLAPDRAMTSSLSLQKLDDVRTERTVSLSHSHSFSTSTPYVITIMIIATSTVVYTIGAHPTPTPTMSSRARRWHPVRGVVLCLVHVRTRLEVRCFVYIYWCAYESTRNQSSH
jgi:hypothetical protein